MAGFPKWERKAAGGSISWRGRGWRGAQEADCAESLAAAGRLERGEAGGRGEGPRGFGEIGVDLGSSVSQFPVM